jgi:sulfate transport system ATP-binding protein
VLLLDEPFGALDARVRKELRRWLRRLHDEQHVTTVIVTHDQEEAMDVADRIVLMHEGRIEQIGDPRELYDAPATEFVRSFFGPVVETPHGTVRPHDLDISLDETSGSFEAMVARVVHLGFEVRVDLIGADGDTFSAQLTRDEEAELELESGQIVFVSSRNGSAATETSVGAPGLRVGDEVL